MSTALDLNSLVMALRATGVPLDRAEETARKTLGITASTEIVRRDSVREKEEQAAVVKLFREHGFKVRSTSQARPSKIAIGFPDLFVTHTRLPLAFFWETKRQIGGIVSEAQKEFGDDCWRCGVRWYAGDRYDAQKLLDEHNLRRAP